MTRLAYRSSAIVVATFWLLSLFAPFHASNENPITAASQRGYMLLKIGALGPLAFSTAWYANFLLLFCFWQLCKGEAPGLRTSLISAVWAYSALLPSFAWNFEQGGWIKSSLSGPAVWLWLTAFTTTAGVSILAATDGFTDPAGSLNREPDPSVGEDA